MLRANVPKIVVPIQTCLQVRTDHATCRSVRQCAPKDSFVADYVCAMFDRSVVRLRVVDRMFVGDGYDDVRAPSADDNFVAWDIFAGE